MQNKYNTHIAIPEPNALPLFQRISTALLLAVTVTGSYLLVASVFVRHDTQMQNVILYDNYQFLYQLLPILAGVFVVGLYLGKNRAYSVFCTIFGKNNQVHFTFTALYWFTVLATYLSFFYGQ